MLNILIRRFAFIFWVLTLASCTTLSALTSKPIKPVIELVKVRPLNISLTEQKLRFELRVINPNAFDMPVESVDFIARFNDTNIASGKSNQAVTIAANSEALLSLDVTAGLDRLANTLKTLLEGNTLDLNYELSGNVKVSNWPGRIPFDVVGAIDLKDT